MNNQAKVRRQAILNAIIASHPNWIGEQLIANGIQTKYKKAQILRALIYLEDQGHCETETIDQGDFSFVQSKATEKGLANEL